MSHVHGSSCQGCAPLARFPKVLPVCGQTFVPFAHAHFLTRLAHLWIAVYVVASVRSPWNIFSIPQIGKMSSVWEKFFQKKFCEVFNKRPRRRAGQLSLPAQLAGAYRRQLPAVAQLPARSCQLPSALRAEAQLRAARSSHAKSARAGLDPPGLLGRAKAITARGGR